MTERLAQLLHNEADHLVVPPPPAAAALTRGRQIRRRHRVTAGAAALAAIVLLGVGVGLATSDDTPRPDAVDPAPPTSPRVDLGATFAIGGTVYVEDGTAAVDLPYDSVRAMPLTSAGVVVVGNGSEEINLITSSGQARALTAPFDVVHSTDPTQPYLAWAEVIDGVMTAVVHDVVTDEDVARVAIPGHTGGFAFTSFDGDIVYVGDLTAGFAVDWTSGVVTPSKHVVVAGGNASSGTRTAPAVVDVDTGTTLLEVDRGSYFALSPDGRVAKLVDDNTDGFTDRPPVDVYDVATGSSITLPRDAYDYGWTSDGELFSLDRQGRLSICSVNGACTTERLELSVRPDEFARIDCNFLDREGCVALDDENYTDFLTLGGSGGSA